MQTENLNIKWAKIEEDPKWMQEVKKSNVIWLIGISSSHMQMDPVGINDQHPLILLHIKHT